MRDRSFVRIRRLRKHYGTTQVLDDLSLDIFHGEYLVLLGPSGCGKTTTMRCLCGLEQPDSGTIAIGERVVFDPARRTNVPTHRRNTAMVFQSYALWPHRTVYENVAFPLRMLRRSRREIARRVHEVLGLLGLTELDNRLPSQLSGGQMQRVALARSLAMEPEVLLLDEPLSNVDANLRERLQVDLKRIQQEFGITTLHVTHDQEEAMALADRMVIMNAGKVVESGRPVDIYERPSSVFVATFVGMRNIYPAEGVSTDTLRVPALDTDLLVAGSVTKGKPYTVAIRPEDIVVLPDGADPPPSNTITAVVEVGLFLGTRVQYEARTADCLIQLADTAGGRALVDNGQRLRLFLPPERLRVLPAPGDGTGSP